VIAIVNKWDGSGFSVKSKNGIPMGSATKTVLHMYSIVGLCYT